MAGNRLYQACISLSLSLCHTRTQAHTPQGNAEFLDD